MSLDPSSVHGGPRATDARTSVDRDPAARHRASRAAVLVRTLRYGFALKTTSVYPLTHDGGPRPI